MTTKQIKKLSEPIVFEGSIFTVKMYPTMLDPDTFCTRKKIEVTWSPEMAHDTNMTDEEAFEQLCSDLKKVMLPNE